MVLAVLAVLDVLGQIGLWNEPVLPLLRVIDASLRVFTGIYGYKGP